MRTLKPKFSSRFALKKKISDKERSWKIFDIAQTEVDESMLLKSLKIEIITRDDPKSGDNTIQENFFSSLRYVLEVSLPSQTFKNSNSTIISKLEIVFSDSPNDKIPNSKEGTPLMDIPEVLPFRKTTTNYSINVKLKLNCVSYHFGRKKFCFKLSFFSSQNANRPLIVLMSAPFLVYSRRKNVKPDRKRKRKRTKKKGEISKKSSENVGEDDEEFSPPKKKRKIDDDVNEAEKKNENIVKTSTTNSLIAHESIDDNPEQQQQQQRPLPPPPAITTEDERRNDYRRLIDQVSEIKESLPVEEQMELIDYTRERLRIPNDNPFQSSSFYTNNDEDDADWFQTPILGDDDDIGILEENNDFFRIDF